MRKPYLVVINNEKSFVYTDSRKVKKMLNDGQGVEVYTFKTIDRYNYWDDVYRIFNDSKEISVDMFESNGHTYTDIGCNIMRLLAKAEWNTSIKYPDNGWHICSECGEITNDISKCWYCGDFVCWDCASKSVNIAWEEGDFCSYMCYRLYLEKNYDIKYEPEEEYKEKVLRRMDRILEWFDKDQLIDILLHIETHFYGYDKDEQNETRLEYEDMTEDDILHKLNYESNEDIYNALMELYEEETDDQLQTILDAEAFINNLDPNDPNDEWFFED